MIDPAAADQLLDFGARLGKGSEERAREQLEGAVAIHNILEKHHVAYLADEVGMGKTYVALGAMALFRHYNPKFRVLVIAPRENLQRKWRKELRNFVEHNVRYPDLRVKALDGKPARSLVGCENLVSLLGESTLDPDRDFFARLSSFSLGLRGGEQVDPAAAREIRDKLRAHLPWLPEAVFDLRNRRDFKDNIARAICCGLPVFDLVIVDEGHNLKYGFTEHAAARNRVLALAFGHPSAKPAKSLFPGYGPRAKRVLFLSATPIEETYTHLWNQLDVFGRTHGFDDLRRADVSDDHKKELAAKFLVRRVTAMKVAGREWTKNLYRREWRAGGVEEHDDPIRVTDVRQRLVVALVQKKVSELIGGKRFGRSFQIGMLASFESFMQTSGVRRDNPSEEGVFDDSTQAVDQIDRDGLDVHELNRLATDYFRKFGRELPHPKMDAVVAGLASAWRTGSKALVFVRRVDSVKELKRKLDECYDQWLLTEMRLRLPEETQASFEQVVKQYEQAKASARVRNEDIAFLDGSKRKSSDADRGGTDTFFAWFFRGEGPKDVISGANIQRRFVSSRGALATFFEDNHVAAILGCRPSEAPEALRQTLGLSADDLDESLRILGRRYLTRAKRHQGADRFEAAQGAALELLKDAQGDHQTAARICWHERFETSLRQPHALEAPALANDLATPTFFSELRLRPELRERIWPSPSASDIRLRFREQELRAQLLATTARLGHAFIDLYLIVIGRLGSLKARAQDTDEGEGGQGDESRISDYLDLLERQRDTPVADRGWRAFDELADAAEQFDLILDVNEPAARSQSLSETTRAFGNLLREQRPVGGMYGAVNQTLVRQFRMPGYPLVLISTDLLQEGEDLHTFCSAIHHYGISWTPSSMEQRIGRIDRVRSATDRRLARLQSEPPGEDLLQVFYPYLNDTVEVLQVAKVLERVNRFLRLMHEGLNSGGTEDRRVHVEREIHRGVLMPPPIQHRLHTAFPVPSWALVGSVRTPSVGRERHAVALSRLRRLHDEGLPGLAIEWERQVATGSLNGTADLKDRRQGFRLTLSSVGEWFCLRCESPVGRREAGADLSDIRASVAAEPVSVVLTEVGDPFEWSLAVEDEVLLADEAHDSDRAAWLVRRVVHAADAIEREHWDGADHAAHELHSHFHEARDGE